MKPEGRRLLTQVKTDRSNKIRLDNDDGLGKVTLLCRGHSSSRSCLKAQAEAAILEAIIIGPVSDVHIVKVLDEYGKEVAIPSIANSTCTSYGLISRKPEHFVSEKSCSQTRAQVQQ